MKEDRIPEQMTPEVFALASRLYAQKNQEFSVEELVKAGAEAQIPAEFIQQAVQQIQAKQLQAQKRQKKLKLILLSIGVVIIFWSILTYNTLKSAAQRVDAAWAQVENQFQRRADLIPNLVSVTQAYARQERELVMLLQNSRQTYLQADSPDEKIAAMAQITQALDQFQNYSVQNPQLQSSQVSINLQYELAGTENRIAVERMRYNQAVEAYNQKVESFPNSLFSVVLGFQPKAFYQAQKTTAPVINPDVMK